MLERSEGRLVLSSLEASLLLILILDNASPQLCLLCPSYIALNVEITLTSILLDEKLGL